EFNAKFDASGGHKHTGAAGDGPKLTSASYAGGSVNDAALGTRTADPATSTAYGLVGSITQWFSWITKYFKAITGKANPFDAPDITLAATKTHVDDTTRHITVAERTAWNAAESNAKNASIPKTEKGSAGGVASLDTDKHILADGIKLGSALSERVFKFSFPEGVENQKIDIFRTGILSGFIEVTVTGVWNNSNAVGKITKLFSDMANSSGVINSTDSMYTDAFGPIVQEISIGEFAWDSPNNRWKITIEGRKNRGNSYVVVIREVSGTDNRSWGITAPYTGVATTLPMSVQTIPDDTATKSGYLIQKHKLTEHDGRSIRLTLGTDLNTILSNGFYNGYALVNAPTVANVWYYVEVQRHYDNDTYVLQRATLLSGSGGEKPVRYERICKQSTWSTWVEIEGADKKNVANGYAGLDANAFVPDVRLSGNIARTSQTIPAKTDLNSFRNEGDYFCPSNANAATVLNMPTAIAGQAFYLRNNIHAGINQSIVSYNSTAFRIYTRNYYSAANPQWSEWMEIEHSGRKNVAGGYAGLDTLAKVPRTNTYNSLGGPSTIPAVDLDLALTAGVYPISPVTLNKPAASMWGQVLVFVSGAETHNNANTWTWQIILQSSGGSHVRFKDAAAAWSPWVPMWTGNNDAPLFMTRNLIANSTDLNTVVNNGVYSIYQPTGLTNAPPVTYGLLSVTKGDTTTNYVKQEIVDIIPGTVYSRSRNGGSGWSSWVTTITSAGGNFTGAVSRTYSDKSVKYSNLATHYAGIDGQTGTLKITLPVGWNAAMMSIKITGYDYSSRGAWEILVGGYNFNTGWMNYSASVTSGSLPFSSVRLAYDGSKCCILLGTTTTVWKYPNIEVTEVLASHNGATGLGGAWAMGVVTTETGITNIVNAPLVGGNADSVGGYSAAQVTQGTLAYAVTSGTTPTLAATFNPAVAALTAGLRVTIKAHAATTGPVTLNVNGLGAKSIKKPNGNNPPLALGGVYTVVYDGTAFILQGEGGEYGTATAAEVLAGKTIGTENGLVNGTMPDRTRAGDSLTYTTALSAKGDGLGSLVMEPQTGYYASGLNSGGFGTLLSVDPNFVPSSILSTRSIFGVQGSIPVITSGDDVAIGVGRWPNGDLAGYPREGYRKGGAGAGELKVTVGQLQSIGYRQYASGRSSKTGGAVNIQYTDGTSYAQDMGNVTGLWFTPRIITAVYTNSQGQKTVTTYIASIGEVVMSPYDTARCKRALLSQNPGIVVNSSGFTMPVFPYNLFGADFEWEAWG
ncbi:pyocin knob domain-containing protein, partial [Paenibacillus odorifer]|uniref:pyocin knob domain-containing protein n=2 Tax=Paenibacillus TaxID=44249 RepID=UPI00096C999D